MVPSVQSILTQRGKVVADSTTNALVITEIASRITRVEEFVKGLDIRTPQVSIQAKIIFVDRTDVEELGVKYDLGSQTRSEEHTSELQSQSNLVCRLLLEKKKNN